MESTIPKVKSPLGILCLALIFSIDLASSDESLGLLSRLYKKAAQQNQPLVLVLDNSHTGDSKTYDKGTTYNRGRTYNKGKVYNTGLHSDELDTDDKFIYLNHYLKHTQKKTPMGKRTKTARGDLDYYKPKNNNRIPFRNTRDRHTHEKRHRHRGDRLDHLSQDRYYDERSRYDSRDSYYDTKDTYNTRDTYDTRDAYNTRNIHHARDKYNKKDRYDTRDTYNTRGKYETKDRHDKRDIYDTRDRYDGMHVKKDTWDRNDLLSSPVLQNLLKISDQLLRKGDCDESSDECATDAPEDECDSKTDDCAVSDVSDGCDGVNNSCDDTDEIRSTKGETLVTVNRNA